MTDKDNETQDVAREQILPSPLESSIQPVTVESFSDLDLPEALKAAIHANGWIKPTPVQALCLPFTLRKRDVAGFAQTGTGKTGVFLITVCNALLRRDSLEGPFKGPSAVVLAPTRELAMQIEDDAQQLLKPLGFKSIAVFGGIDYEKQARVISEGVDIIVGTPGRFKDYFNKKIFDLSQCQVFVCDEADRMFDMGFIDDVEYFLDKLPETSQRLLFSATTNENVKELAFEYLNQPEYLSVSPESITPKLIKQQAIICEAKNKLRVLIGLIRDHNPNCSIIFTNTKIAAEWLHFKLTNNGIQTDIITGDLPQRQRISLIKRIKEGQVKALIATDVASRGLHIAGVSHVYNFDLPDDPQNYVHRIGRTARAGASGCAVSLVCEDYGQNLAAINNLLGDAAMKSEWYEEKYLSIDDNAGNPFHLNDSPKAFQRAKSQGRGPSRAGRSGGRDGNRRPSRGPNRNGNQKHSRGPEATNASRNDQTRSSQGRSQPHAHANGNRAQQPPSRRPQGGHGQRGRYGNDRRPQQAPRSQHARSPQSTHKHAAKPLHAPVQGSSTIGSMIKKFFGALFGSK